jgi:uncharacterized membrane protein YeaQ/YmgE (transglycosylase-associated protein family)
MFLAKEAALEGVNIFTAVVIGILAGWIAERVLNRRHGLFTNLIVGVIGSFVGAFLMRELGLAGYRGFFPSLMVSSLGAIVFLAVLSIIRRRK